MFFLALVQSAPMAVVQIGSLRAPLWKCGRTPLTYSATSFFVQAQPPTSFFGLASSWYMWQMKHLSSLHGEASWSVKGCLLQAKFASIALFQEELLVLSRTSS